MNDFRPVWGKMRESTGQRFQKAMEEYNADQYESALKLFADLTIDLTLEGRDEAVEEIIHCIEMAIASYHKMEDTPIPDLSGGDLFEHFFETMRTYMDTREVTDPKEVERELSKEIPLNDAMEGYFVFGEGKVIEESGKLGPYHYAAVSAQGPRATMEDEHLAAEIILPDGENVFCFAVLDGHGGSSCARFVKDRLAYVFKEELEKTGWRQDIEIYNALRKGCIRLDREWTELPIQQDDLRDYSGTTAVIALFFGKRLFVANVGDSRAVLAVGSKAIQLSEDAEQNTEKYMREIVLRGGIIQLGRVLGNRSTLDMARSIGDLDQVSVSALPSIKKYDFAKLKTKSFLILACDGLWDVVSSKMAAEVCADSASIDEIALKLEKIAYQRGSADNVTVFIIGMQKEP